jgi:hypothetical protein
MPKPAIFLVDSTIVFPGEITEVDIISQDKSCLKLEEGRLSGTIVGVKEQESKIQRASTSVNLLAMQVADKLIDRNPWIKDETDVGVILCSSFVHSFVYMEEELPKFILRCLVAANCQIGQKYKFYGPSTVLNSSCSSTCYGVAMAQDWIRGKRCKHVVVIGADQVCANPIRDRIFNGFKILGAISKGAREPDICLPFGEKRSGIALGDGAVSLLLSQDSPNTSSGTVELVATELGLGQGHPLRLDIDRMVCLLKRIVEANPEVGTLPNSTVYLAHETCTGGKKGCAVAETEALRRVFSDKLPNILVTGTKGHTGHTMGAGVEHGFVKHILDTGMVPRPKNLEIPDPALGEGLNFPKKGVQYPVQYLLRFSAGFGGYLAYILYKKKFRLVN